MTLKSRGLVRGMLAITVGRRMKDVVREEGREDVGGGPWKIHFRWRARRSIRRVDRAWRFRQDPLPPESNPHLP
jgi:hypothetical protein